MNIQLKVSKLQLYTFCGLTIIITLLLILLEAPGYWKLITIVLLGLGNCWVLRNYFFRFQKNSVMSLTKITKEIWKIDYISGKNFTGVLQGDSVTTTFFSILILKSPHYFFKKTVLIFKDMMSDKDYHLLQLYLKGLLSD